MSHFYLLPLDIQGNRRGPAYLRWRCNPSGQLGRWSLKDFGNACDIGLVIAEQEIARAGDALAIPIHTGNLTRSEHANIATYLRQAGVEPTWLRVGDSRRETLHKLLGITQMHQAAASDPTVWLGREIHCGFVKLNAVDRQMFEVEQAAKRAIAPLRVRQSFANIDWRAYFAWLLEQPHLMPFYGALPATDAFTASNGTALTTYSANWTYNYGAFSINTNSVHSSGAQSENQAAHWNADTFNNNQYAQIVIAAISSGVYIGVAVRCATSGQTWYNYVGNSADSYLEKYVSATYTQLGSTAGAFANTNTIRIEANGATITPLKNGSQTGTPGAQTDSGIASGYGGIAGAGNGTTSRGDSWEGGNLTSSQTITPSGIATAAAFGTAKVNRSIIGSGIASAGAFGSTTVRATQTIAPSAIASAEAFGSTTVTQGQPSQTITPSGIASAEAFGTTKLNLRLPLTGIASGAAFGSTELLMAACINGVLTVSATNGRYFENDDGPLVLAGFHTWYNVQDGGPTDPPAAFDWDEYLAALIDNNCNFTKLWAMETPRGWSDDSDQWMTPTRYSRTGPGNDNDGKLKFDLTQINPAYLSRLRERAIEAGNAGIYVVIQLFQGWQVESGSIKGTGSGTPGLWHPYNQDNNINSLNPDDNADDDLRESQYLTDNPALAYQEDLTEAIVDVLNDLDNIIFEICNESTGSTANTDWQEHLIDHIKTYEAGKPQQHLVGMTVQYPSGSNSALDASGADWVSYNASKADAEHSASDPVSAYDTDHTVGLTTDTGWALEAFCNGHGGTWYMDPWDGALYGTDTRNDSTYNTIRRLTGDVLAYASQIDLANATPQGGLSTTGWCLAKTAGGSAQLFVYQDGSGAFDVTLTGLSGIFTVEWFRVSTGEAQAGSNVNGGAVRTLTPPWSGAVAAFLEQSAQLISPTGIASVAAFGVLKVNRSVIAAAIASAEAFGSAKANLQVAPSAIASAEAHGTQRVNLSVAPSAIASGEAHGSTKLNLVLLPTGIVSAGAFGAHTLLPGAVTLLLSAITSGEAFGSALVSAGGTIVNPGGIASAEAFGSPTIVRGAVTLLLSAIVSGETFGGALVTSGATVISPGGIASAAAFGTAQINLRLFMVGIASAGAFGSATLAPGSVTVLPGGIASAMAFGDTLVTAGGLVISVTGIASAELYGATLLTPGVVIVQPSGIASGEVVGNSTQLNSLVAPTGISSAEAFGVSALTLRLLPASVGSAEAFGATRLRLYLLPVAIGSTEAFGSPALALRLILSGVASGAAFGSHALTTGAVAIQPAGIASGQAFGTAFLTAAGILYPVAIGSGETFGAASVAVGVAVIGPAGIDSAEAFGAVRARLIWHPGRWFRVRAEQRVWEIRRKVR